MNVIRYSCGKGLMLLSSLSATSLASQTHRQEKQTNVFSGFPNVNLRNTLQGCWRYRCFSRSMDVCSTLGRFIPQMKRTTFMTLQTRHPKDSPRPLQTLARPAFSYRWLALTGSLVTVAAALFMAAPLYAQTPATAAPAPATTVAQAAPKYSTKDIEQAFSFIDSNKDGKLSREEASGFRGVARHFDEADLNKDSILSREEFENALSGGGKSR